MKIAYITAGAADMICGSCLRDNTLARTLLAQGHDVMLVPTYTPTRTDEPNVSIPRVFLGGINLYLQHRSILFRHTPRIFDRLLDSRSLLRWAAGRTLQTDAQLLGGLTVSTLQGEDGPHRKEFARLADWLADEVKPDVVDLSNSLLIALADSIKRRTACPVICSLSGEDLFLEGLTAPWHDAALELVRRHVRRADAFIAFNQYYASFMSEYLAIPDSKLFQVPLGISLNGYHAAGDAKQAPERAVDSAPCAIGYLARICPEKGLHTLCQAFHLLRRSARVAPCRLRIAGYLGAKDHAYWADLQRQIAQWGLADSVDFLGEIDRDEKVRFLRSIDVFSVPTVYHESKGLSLLEAWANGIPVVQPWHGVFTELVNQTQGGVLVPPNDPVALGDAIAQLLGNAPLRLELGRRGRQAVERLFTAERMAEATLRVYEQVKSRTD